jgi:hypothetical protein
LFHISATAAASPRDGSRLSGLYPEAAASLQGLKRAGFLLAAPAVPDYIVHSIAEVTDVIVAATSTV